MGVKGLKMDRYDSKVWLLLIYIHKISILKKIKNKSYVNEAGIAVYTETASTRITE